MKGNWIKFLGTAGARFVMIKQLRASGGIWINSNDTNVLIDPGPGSIVRCFLSKPQLDPVKLDAIVLTHRHLDHSSDLNVMIEAMTEGGFKRRGMVFCPKDAIEKDPVILSYLREFPEKIEFLYPLSDYRVENFAFKTSPKQSHPVETYGLKFKIDKLKVSFIADTAYYPGLEDFYKADIVIMPVVFYEPNPRIQHLSFCEAKKIIEKIKPVKAILTHFGMDMLKNKPHLLCRRLSRKTGLDIIAAYDGMKIDISRLG